MKDVENECTLETNKYVLNRYAENIMQNHIVLKRV